jgi:hypothetical protein
MKTDNEMGLIVGKLVRKIEHGKIDADDDPQKGGPKQEVVTTYEYDAYGRLAERSTIRGKKDSAESGAVDPTDYVERWQYHPHNPQLTSGGYLSEYVDTLGKVTQYQNYQFAQPGVVQNTRRV